MSFRKLTPVLICALLAACAAGSPDIAPEPTDDVALPSAPGSAIQSHDDDDEDEEDDCSPPSPKVIGLNNPKGASAKRGKKLFLEETFGGDRGMACGDCHRPDTFMGLTPHKVQQLFAQNPSHPLFHPLDGDFGGNTYDRLKTTATIRIPMTLPASVRVVSPQAADAYTDAQGNFHPLGSADPDYFVKPDGTRIVVVNRAVPDTVNVAFETTLMYDGREGGNLSVLGTNAVKTHAGMGIVLPTGQQADDMAEFQRGLFSSNALKKQHRKGIPAQLPPGRNALEQQGRTFFVSGTRGLCAQCHSGENMDETDEFNATSVIFNIPPGAQIATNFSEELMPPDPVNYPTRLFEADDPFGGPPRPSIPVHDPGMALATGNPCDDIGVCIINSGGPGLPPYGFRAVNRNASLHGLKKKLAAGHPLMHHGRIPNLEAALDQVYIPLFEITASGLEQAIPGVSFNHLRITPSDRAAIIAYASNNL